MSYIKHHPDYDDMVEEGLSARRQASALRRRALRHPDPRDPDALDEEDRERLEELEN